MLKELEDVLVLVRLLPARHQKEAARRLQQVVLRAEEETMTWQERGKLMSLRSAESMKRVAAITERAKKRLRDMEE